MRKAARDMHDHAMGGAGFIQIIEDCIRRVSE